MKKFILRYSVSLLGGASLGLLIASLSYSPFWRSKDLLNSRNFLLETMFGVMTRILPISIMRWLHSAAGIVLFWLALGMATGCLAGWIRKNHQSLFQRFIFSIACSAATFSFVFLIAYFKTLFFFPATAMLSIRGALSVFISILLSAGIGAALFFLLKQNKTASLLVVVMMLSLSSFTLAVQRRTPQNPEAKRTQQIILVGVDAADWSVLFPLLKAGKLPNMKRLLEEGSYGALRATVKISSPIIWTSIATGKRKEQHGIYDYVLRQKDGVDAIPISLSFRKANALWDMASQHTMKTDVVAWYGSWPAEPINGCFVSDRTAARELDLRVYPPERLNEIEGFALQQSDLDTSSTAAIGLHLLRIDKPRLLLIYFRALDSLQHYLWKYHALKRGPWPAKLICGSARPDQITDLGSKIEEEYIRMDGVIRDILGAAQEDATIFIVSDHGVGIARGPMTYFDLRGLLEKLGWLSYEANSREVDWSKTLIFNGTQDLKRLLPMELLLNSREESPFKTKPELYQKSSFLKQALETLAGLETTTGKKIFVKLRASAEGDAGLMKLNAWPNFELRPNDEIAIGKEKLSVKSMLGFNRLSGMHRTEGIFIAKGPGIKQGYRVKDASILDITPTILYFLGLPQALDMDGGLLKRVVDPAYLRRNPVLYIPTYESGQPRKIPAQKKSAADEKILDTLRSLGYIR